MERSIKKEVAGEKPTGGAKDWDEFWNGWIVNISTHFEGDKKGDYIIRRRRETGLPELK